MGFDARRFPTQTPISTVESLKAQVVADKLSCRYGPGAEYLYLFALNSTANIKLVGRTDANNWVWVENKGRNNTNNNCWVNAKFLNIQGDLKSLPIVYPGLKLPVSPYYPGPSWAKATREGDTVKITWEAVPISPGKYERLLFWRGVRNTHGPKARFPRHEPALLPSKTTGAIARLSYPEGQRRPRRGR